ncbi:MULTISPECIES: flagellar assembly protein FliW [unclassified Cohnella]|uniref:flagellar assembly protein FliW n=1 Tax=unclassified Cohnella TaxID=2636738 RepID=UPI0013046F3B|nr:MULTISPECIES: flagellar assembly protein FliW [unclassified Cohnella]
MHNQTEAGLPQMNEKLIYNFEEGLPGFAHCKRFVLAEEEANKPFGTLKCLDSEETSFVIVDPFFFFKEYEFELPEHAIKELQLVSSQSLIIRVIVTWRGSLSSATVNLVAPVILNANVGLGKQIILSNTSYTARHRLFEPR